MRHAYDIGRATPLTVEVTASVCGECGTLADPDGAARLSLRAATAAVLRAGVANGRTFRLLRDALGLQGKEVASLTFAAQGTVSRWENDHRSPDTRAWALLARLAADGSELAPATAEILAALRTPRPLADVEVTFTASEDTR